MPDPTPTPSRPLTGLPVVGGAPVHPHQAQPRHETVLPPEPAAAMQALAAALAEGGHRAALASVAAAHPAMLEAWARLSEVSLRAGDAVSAYAFARVAYHRGLDRLRREGWGGVGLVRWRHPTNRPFLRGLHALLAAAAMLEELDEAERCRAFLVDTDPDDAIGAASYPTVLDRTWTAPILPD